MERLRLGNLFTSGHYFNSSADDRHKFQMLNMAISLSSFALVFVILMNVVVEQYILIPFELFLLFVNIVMFFRLRKNKNHFSSISNLLTIQFTIFFIFLFYFYEPSDLKHIWFFTYPIILLYFQELKNGFYWLIFLIAMFYISLVQPWIETYYSLYHVTYLSFVLLVVSVIMYYYKVKMDEARELVLQQQVELQNFNTELEGKVEQKTLELQELNEHLEVKVKNKIQELIEKDELLTLQSKQAVMGEMISMIAHQWRQPLSTITLQISNLHIKRLMGEDVSLQESDKVLGEISNTIVYLSDTIDDFQTYFRPNKKRELKDIHEVCKRSINFLKPRLKELDIDFVCKESMKIELEVYDSELVQVILNILNNSIDAFIERKKSGIIEISLEKKEDRVELFIKDNAGGISKKHIKKIFEPYYSTKGKNGTGIGLYMSQMIIEKQFKGRISVDSRNGETTFCIQIPRDS